MSEPVAVPAPAPIPVEQLQFAMPPVHASPDEERTYRRERLAGALRLFGQLGYEDGVPGTSAPATPNWRTASGSTRSARPSPTSPRRT